MICQRCGNENVDYARFCLTCGTAFQPQQAAQPPTPTVFDDRQMRAMLPVGNAPMAVAAMWVGLVSLLCCFLGPVAIVLSIVALVELNRDPDKGGKVHAIFGLIAGSVTTLIAIIFLMSSLYR
jgi:hypothetical protein